VWNRFAVYDMIVADKMEAWVLGDGDGALRAIVFVQRVDMISALFRKDEKIWCNLI